MALTPPPAVPQRGDRTTFSSRVDAFLTWMAALVGQLNTFLAQLTSMAGGGAYSIPFALDTGSTTNADPGTGKFRFNQASQSTASELYVDTSSSQGVDVSGQLSQFGVSSSTIKGSLKLVAQNDPSKFLVFNVSSVSTLTGYYRLVVVPVSASAASPFANTDVLLFQFTRSGDKGDKGDVGAAYILLGQATVSTAVANIDFLTLFSSAYDKYVVEVQGVSVSSTGDQLAVRLANAGSIDTQNNYMDGRTSTNSISAGNPSFLVTGNTFTNTSSALQATIEVRNCNDAVKAKGFGVRGAGGFEAISREGLYTAANAVSGFRIFWNGGSNFTSGTVRVYGIKNS